MDYEDEYNYYDEADYEGEDVVWLTDRYVAPREDFVPAVEESRSKNNSRHSEFSPEDFDIFLSLRPPPEEKEDEEERVKEITASDCPGDNLRDCIGVACVSLPQLWVYSVCVRECSRRCP